MAGLLKTVGTAALTAVSARAATDASPLIFRGRLGL